MQETMDQRRGRAQARALVAVAAAALPLLALVATRPFGLVVPARAYLPIHVTLEVLVVAAGLATFSIQWFASSAGTYREARARFIGPAFLAAAILELAHLMSFPGMPGFFGPATTERGIAYWLAARVTTVGALLAALRIDRESRSPLLGRRRLLAASLAFVAVVLIVELAAPADRAVFFVEGRGLTPLKAFAEAAIGAAAAIGAILHLRAWRTTGEQVSAKLAIALALAAYGELCFMLYASAYDPFNVTGHVYLVVSSWFVFDALFVAALIRPYRELDALRAHVEDELVVTIRRLRQSTEQRDDLLRAVSHDLRNPLQIVLLQAQRLVRALPAGQGVRPASAILTATKRMERMLRDLADSARAEGGQLHLAPAPVPLRGFVADLLEGSDGVLDAARVVNDVPEGLPPVLADPDRLDRILGNLLGNALKYSRAEVRVAAASDGQAVLVSVHDRGPGIEADDLPRIFDRYYRGQRHEGEGLGLGLFIVRKLVEAHGGRIWAESVPGTGSTFTFTLPAA
jgi:signal transduction histidine kinase